MGQVVLYPSSEGAHVQAQLRAPVSDSTASFRVLFASYMGTGHLQQQAAPVIGDLCLEAAYPWVGVEGDRDAYSRRRRALGTGRRGGGSTERRGAWAPAGWPVEEVAGVPGFTQRWMELISKHGLHKTPPRSVGDDAVPVTPVWLRVPSSQNNSSPTTGPGHRTRSLDAFCPWAQSLANLAFLWKRPWAFKLCHGPSKERPLQPSKDHQQDMAPKQPSTSMTPSSQHECTMEIHNHVRGARGTNLPLGRDHKTPFPMENLMDVNLRHPSRMLISQTPGIWGPASFMPPAQVVTGTPDS